MLPLPLSTARASLLFAREEEKKERVSIMVVVTKLLLLLPLAVVVKARLGGIMGLVDTFTALVPGIESVFSRLWPCVIDTRTS